MIESCRTEVLDVGFESEVGVHLHTEIGDGFGEGSVLARESDAGDSG